jgi:hypothetical protein
MVLLSIWVSQHRNWLYGIIAMSLWVAAYWVYLKGDFHNYFKSRRPHHWSVDMVTKTTKGGRPTLH